MPYSSSVKSSHVSDLIAKFRREAVDVRVVVLRQHVLAARLLLRAGCMHARQSDCLATELWRHLADNFGRCEFDGCKFDGVVWLQIRRLHRGVVHVVRWARNSCPAAEAARSATAPTESLLLRRGAN